MEQSSIEGVRIIIREINKNDNLILDKENTKEGKIVVQYGRFKKE